MLRTDECRDSGLCTAEREREFFDSLVAAEKDFNPFTAQGWETLARRFEMVPPRRPIECWTSAAARDDRGKFTGLKD